MQLPSLPDLKPISRDFEEEISGRLQALTDGISEFTFPGLFLFRDHYEYHVGLSPDNRLVVSGERPDGSFFLLPQGLPDDDHVLLDLFNRFDYLKNLPGAWVTAARERLEPLGFAIIPDRNNFDYLYHSEDLATLAGKKFHKKRNHVNAFLKHYNSTVEVLDDSREQDALTILENWREGRDDEADYSEALETLKYRNAFGLDGIVVYVDDLPVGYAMGEPVGKSETFIIHVEKALPEYRGLYQFLNKAFAERIAQTYPLINREQDLGDEGLRQAKMTYRPCGFIEKFRVVARVESETRKGIPSEEPEAVGCCCSGKS